MNSKSAWSRRTLLEVGAAAALAQLTGCRRPERADAGERSQSTGAEPAPFNYILGTQTIGATYQFTSESVLVETAQAILAMGSNLLKFTMGRGSERVWTRPSKAVFPETMQYLLNQGSDARERPRLRYPGATIAAVPEVASFESLSDLARNEPSCRKVLAMPFDYYLIWTYSFAPRWWLEGFPPAEQEKEYREIYAFVEHLLETYSGTGKTFFLGHWEGDWHLRSGMRPHDDAAVTGEALRGMTDWLNARQRAVDDAKRRTPHHGVEVYHYTEVNLVSRVSMSGRPSVTNDVLPGTAVDFVSYSSYDSLRNIQKKLPAALDYIESKLPPKPGIAGKRVFIGEYGFPALSFPESERDLRSRQVMRVGLEWGAKFVLCWQMYNNEIKAGTEKGYWLIDDQGVRQPLWHTLASFYAAARSYVADSERQLGRPPSDEEFRRFALDSLREVGSAPLTRDGN